MGLNLVRFDDHSPMWDEFVEGHPLATNYHRFGWKRIMEKSFGHSASYLGVQDCTGKLKGILPLVQMTSLIFGRFMVSLPFVNYGGLLCSSAEAEAMLLNQAAKLLTESGADYVEMRHSADRNLALPVKTHKVTMILDLQHDVETQWRGFNAKLRNQVRKAQKSGLTVEFGGSELLEGFYEVFCRNMRDLGTPVYGKQFFQNVLASFPQSTRIITVFSGRSPIASGLICWFRDTVEMPWASSIKDYKALCPNNVLYWETICFCIENGFRKFDFGRSTPGEGTFRFKEQWGAQPVQLHWNYLMRSDLPLPELNPKNPKYQLAIKMWQRLPVALTKMLGPAIVRSIP